MQRGYPITIYVSAKKEQWFVQPPKSLMQEFKKKHKPPCIYGIYGEKNKKKLIKVINDITDLILSKKSQIKK